MSERRVVSLDEQRSEQAWDALAAKLRACGIEGVNSHDGLVNRPCMLVTRPGSIDSTTLVTRIRFVEYKRSDDRLRLYLELPPYEFLTPSTLNQGRWQLAKGQHVLSSFDVLLTF